MIYDLFTFSSITLSATTIFLQLLVLYLFAPDVKYALAAAFTKQQWSETQALKTGISLVIIGDICDSIYWAIAWTLDLLGSSNSIWWFHNGVYANLPFRQIIPAIGAALHLYAIYFRWDAIPWCHIIVATVLTGIVVASGIQ